jgi:signal transduction histidine kinase
LRKVYGKAPAYNERMSSSSKYTIIDEKKGNVRYKFEILDERLRRLYSIGCECFWHVGILSCIPKIQNPNDASTEAKHDICSLKIGHILRGCYNIFEPRYQYTRDGLLLDGKLVAKWIKFRPDSRNESVLPKDFQICDADAADAMLVNNNIVINGSKAFEEGEIYNAPYCIFDVKYQELNPLKRFFMSRKISPGILENQLKQIEDKARESERLRWKEEDTRKKLEIALKELKRYSTDLEEMVDVRTKELRQAHAKLIESEKRTLEHRITGGFAHEMRNALAGAQLEFKTILDYRRQGYPVTVALKEAITNLFRIIEIFHQDYDIPRERVAREAVPYFKDINIMLTELSQTIDDIHHDVDRGLSITTQIRDYAKMSEIKPGDETVDIGLLLKTYQERYRTDFERIGITYTVEGLETAFVKADEIHINSIFSNLVLNAKDALEEVETEQAKEIKVTVEKRDDETGDVFVITVADNGPGIPEGNLNEIFEPFYSTKPTTGTGLGLGVVKRLVQLYGGIIEVNSNPGEGTTFTVTLKEAKHG